ncbi:MAG: dTDP-4-dehydrorhamnose reductase [Oscillospiraceae bacterium]|nr:dTDP-4-dehydrorhamnose reductase [Oscillospiraceae bacterium]
MKILVTGASGQLGYDVCAELYSRGIEYQGISSGDVDITDQNAFAEYVKMYQPASIIHCAAYTAVDKAESEREKCFAVNEAGTCNVAKACRQIGAKMVYLSTDYVFPGEGDHFYEVNAPTGPKNVYGESKLAGERAVRETLEEHFIVRISWVFGRNGKNFIKTMLHLAESYDHVRVVNDQIGSPTYTADLAPLLCEIAMTENYGTYHATNEGTCSWADLAQEVFRLAKKNTRVKGIPTSEYFAPAVRPLNSRLSKRSLDEAGFLRLPNWKEAVERFLYFYKNS